jgi:23S rRNA (uracil-5-)-methyltransferase RumA
MSSKKSNMFSSSKKGPHYVGVPEKDPESGQEDRHLQVEALAAGGRGVARDESGLVWFVSGAVPGDLVLARRRTSRSRFVEGEVVRVERPSPQRRAAPCPVQQRCGGCPWMVLEEGVQREWKRRILSEALTRIAGIESPVPGPVLAGHARLGYRNKVEFSLGPDARGRPAVGLHAVAGARGLVDVPACAVQHESANTVLSTAREFLLEPGRRIHGRRDRDTRPRLVIRRSWATGEQLLVLRAEGEPFPGASGLAALVTRRHPEVRGVVLVTAAPRRRGGARSEALAGRSWIEESLAGQSFRLPAATFLQVNTEVAAELIGLVTEAAGAIEGGTVLDLYGGVGAYGFALARAGASRIDVCDADGEAVACGRHTAREAGLAGLGFHRADAARFLGEQAEERTRYDLVVANPPRTGLGRGVADRIRRLQPPRVILVSCDPATLARDLRALIGAGYRLERITPVDMFPQTAHIETLALLTRPTT